MKTLLRGCFAALIVLGLASQVLRASRGDADADPQAALLARLERIGIHAAEIQESRLLKAESPRCAQSFAAGLLRSDGGDNELARQFDRPGVEVRQAYLGAVDAWPSTTRLLLRWGRETLRFNLGLRPTKPTGDVVFVAYPAECRGLATTDWASLSP
jgi:hypothetical protein